MAVVHHNGRKRAFTGGDRDDGRHLALTVGDGYGGGGVGLGGHGVRGLHLVVVHQDGGQLGADGGAIGVKQVARLAGNDALLQANVHGFIGPCGHGQVVVLGDDGLFLASRGIHIAPDDGGQLGTGHCAVTGVSTGAIACGQSLVLSPGCRVGVPLACHVAEAGRLGDGGLTLDVVKRLEHGGTGHGGGGIKPVAGGAHHAGIHHVLGRRSVPGCAVHADVLDGNAALGCTVLLSADHAAQHLIGVVDQGVFHGHGGHGHVGGVLKYAVGVAASGGEVVGGHGVHGLGIKGLAAHGGDGHAAAGVGRSVVGGVFVHLAVFVGGGGVDAKLDSRNLGEGADGGGGGAGGGLKGLQQLGTGHVDGHHGVAEGEHRLHVIHGDLACGDTGADAAAVGQRGVHLILAQVLLGLPQQGVGGEVAQVGLHGAHAGGALAIQVHLGLAEGLAHLFQNSLVFGIHQGRHIGVHFGVLGGRYQLRRCLGAVGDDHADVFQVLAGGNHDGGPRLQAAVQLAVGVAIDDHVHTGNLVKHVGGAVGLALRVHTQVYQSNDVLAAIGLQGIHLGLSTLHKLLTLIEAETLHIVGMGLGHGLGGIQTEHAHLANGRVKAHVIPGQGLLGGLVHDIGGQDGELCLGHVGLQGVHLVVELVVAQGRCIIARCVHKVHGRRALIQAHQGGALAKVTC